MSELLHGVMFLTRAILIRKELNQQLDDQRLLNYLLSACLFGLTPQSK